MPQIVHRPAILDDEERYPFGNVLCKEYPYPENQGESFDDPKNPVKDLFVAGCGFVVGDVSKEVPHGIILPRSRLTLSSKPSNLRFYCELPNFRAYFHSASASGASGGPYSPANGIAERIGSCSWPMAMLVLGGTIDVPALDSLLGSCRPARQRAAGQRAGC